MLDAVAIADGSSDKTLTVDLDGAGAGTDTVTIVLQGVDGSSATFLDDLIASNKLVVL